MSSVSISIMLAGVCGLGMLLIAFAPVAVIVGDLTFAQGFGLIAVGSAFVASILLADY